MVTIKAAQQVATELMMKVVLLFIYFDLCFCVSCTLL